MRVRFTVAYDGRHFHGFAENAGVRTVQGELRSAFEKLIPGNEPVVIVCAGRTDKGVHATGQVISVDLPEGVDLVATTHRLNRLVGPHIALRDARTVDDHFNARFSARSRTYRYVVWNRPEPDPFRVGRAWHVAEPLSLDLLRLACDPFIGEHDFSSFCRVAVRVDGSPAPLTRRVIEATWHVEVPGELVLSITASSFCHQMVRSVVGTMVDVGRGRRRAGDIAAVIAAKDRSAAGNPAPPDGLYLVSVEYPAASEVPHGEVSA